MLTGRPVRHQHCRDRPHLSVLPVSIHSRIWRLSIDPQSHCCCRECVLQGWSSQRLCCSAFHQAAAAAGWCYSRQVLQQIAHVAERLLQAKHTSHLSLHWPVNNAGPFGSLHKHTHPLVALPVSKHTHTHSPSSLLTVISLRLQHRIAKQNRKYSLQTAPGPTKFHTLLLNLTTWLQR
jgi:hypothetical protein